MQRFKLHWKRWLVVLAVLAAAAALFGGCKADTAVTYSDEDLAGAVFGYYWSPTALMGMYDWYVLEEPEYDEAIWAEVIAAKDDPTMKIDAATAYPSVPLTITIHPSLRDIAPDVVAVMEKMELGLDRMNKTAAWAKANEDQVAGDWGKVAEWFLAEYDDVWKGWVTTDAYNNVKAALDGNMSTPDASKPTIKIYDGSWESLWISNAILVILVEQGYGYPTETILMTTPIMQVSLADGDVHVNMEMWSQNIIAWYDEEIANGNIESVAVILEGGPQFFVIPEWIHEKYDIDTVDDMKEHWALFQDPEDPTKGAFYNCIIGWQCAEINRVKMETYGLTEFYNIISPGSAGALEAALAGPQKRHEGQ